ncbi:dihydrolipoamide succinyltransferase, partial [Streptomyces eurythermus]
MRATKPSATSSPAALGRTSRPTPTPTPTPTPGSPAPWPRTRGHYADPAARETAPGLLPQPVRVHAAPLSAPARLVPAAAPGEPAVAAR